MISIVLGFTKYNIIVEPVFQGMENYRRLMEDVKFMKAVKNTFKLAIMIVPFQVMISLFGFDHYPCESQTFSGETG